MSQSDANFGIGALGFVMRRIGVISDTHGLLRPQAMDALRGCDPIIHAGDVGRPDVLDQLRGIAPVFAVRGNVDHGPWARELPESRLVEVDGCLIHVLHSLDDLASLWAAVAFRFL